jgi:hypothetical protein
MKNIVVTIIALFASIAMQAQSAYKTENIFIITFDGLRWQELFTGADGALVKNKTYVKDPVGLKAAFWADNSNDRRKILLPFFWSVISEKGQIFGNRAYGNKVNCSNHMWFSYPGYNEILTGFSDDARIKSNNKIDNPNVTVLEFLNKQSSFKGKVAAFGSWDVFPFIINEGRSGIPVNAGFEPAMDKELTPREAVLNDLQAQTPSPWDGVRLDAFTYNYGLEYLQKNKPRVVFISFGETDDFAHDGKYDAYLKSAQRTDNFIKPLWNWTQSQPEYKDKTTFLITTDHGRGTEPLDSWRSHGTEIAGSDQIWFAILGPDVEPKGEMKTPGQYYQNQVAKTAAHFLGLNYTNEKPVGEVIAPIIGNAK